MANMRAIRTRIKSVKNTEQITKAMKMVAVSKLRRTQSSMQAMRPFSEKSQEVMDTLLSASSGLENRFIKPHKEVKKVCYVLFLGNRGLCGAYNSAILHYANSVIRQAGKEYGLVVCGRWGKDVLAKVDGQKTYTMDAAVLMSDARSQYEEMFTSSIWSQQIDGKTFEEYVKDQIKVKLIRVRCMNAMAKEKGIVLGREEKDGVKKAAEKYYNALTEEQRSRYNITEDKLNQMFTEFAIAQKLYNDQTSLMDIEISADDSRVINIQYIVTDSKDEIEKAYAELKEGNSFFAIAKKYNSDGEYEYELRRGEMDSKFEEAAYALSTGEMSNIVEAEGKYYIIRCTSDNDKAKTEVNKSAILADKKLAAFNEKFEEYEAGKYVEWNDSEWEKLSVSSAVIYNVKFEDTFNTITIN